VNQERQQGKEKIHAAGAALDYRARGLTGESIHELLGGLPLRLSTMLFAMAPRTQRSEVVHVTCASVGDLNNVVRMKFA